MEFVLGALCVILLSACVVMIVQWQKVRSELKSQCGLTELANKQIEEQSATLRKKEQEVEMYKEQLSGVQIENARLNERMKIIEKEYVKLQMESELRFKNLANEILATQTEKLRQNNELRLGEILKPLKDNISEFRKTVLDTYTNETKERYALSKHIQDLMALNTSIGKDARDLTEALKGNSKIQGDWGEMVLESILEKSGLIKDENYFVQVSRNENGELLTDTDGRALRPDVVVCLPDKKYIVIDSKVSLTAYTNYVNADTEEERLNAGKAHVASVRKHIKELENKKYQDYVGVSADNRIDYVLMFIPNEHAYLVAMSLDKQLWQDAYDKRIVVISPAHVISTLRLIAQLWTRDRQTKNALKIATESGKLYDKFVGFLDDMKNIEDYIGKAQNAYSSAYKKLATGNGNLISKVESLKALGARTTKSLSLPSED